MNVMEALAQVFSSVIVPVLLLFLSGLATIILAKIQRYEHVSDAQLLATKDTQANVAITNAMNTFAGLVMSDVNTGKLTLHDVQDGEVTKKMLDYLNMTVKDSMLHFNKPPEDLTKMLVGKLTPMVLMSQVASTDASVPLVASAVTALTDEHLPPSS